MSSSSFLGALDTDARSPETKFTTHSKKKIWMRTVSYTHLTLPTILLV